MIIVPIMSSQQSPSSGSTARVVRREIHSGPEIMNSKPGSRGSMVYTMPVHSVSEKEYLNTLKQQQQVALR
ncbi:MAG: hypothetical protein QNJ31_07680 [Candidatus Caenarcaniphilales bacterium]|nr:hypothetical protein [Candidatus Caenarcaniphilales bacterium]